MYKTVIENSELEKWRNFLDARYFIEDIFSRIEANYNVEGKPYRLSQGNYKNFSEEYIPIYKYLEYKFKCDENIEFRHLGVGNQAYDGEIRSKDNKIDKIEIAYPLLGLRSKQHQQNIIEKGAASQYYAPEILFKEIRSIIIETAEKKSRKQYNETVLVIYYAFSEDLFPGDVGLSEKTFYELISDIKKIQYEANIVDFFVPEFKYSCIYGNMTKPARLYKIKKC